MDRISQRKGISWLGKSPRSTKSSSAACPAEKDASTKKENDHRVFSSSSSTRRHLIGMAAGLLLGGTILAVVMDCCGTGGDFFHSFVPWFFFFQSSSSHEQTIAIISAAGNDSVAKKQKLMLETTSASYSSASSSWWSFHKDHNSNNNNPRPKIRFHPVICLAPEQQRQYVQAHKCGIQRYDDLVQRHQQHLATELFKYCCLAHQTSDALYIDANSPLLVSLEDILQVHSSSPHGSDSTTTASHRSSTCCRSSWAILGHSYFPETMHGSLLLLRQPHLHLATRMVQLLVETPLAVLEASPLLIQRTLYQWVHNSVNMDGATKATNPTSTAIATTASTSTTTTSHPNNTLLRPGPNGLHWYLLEQKCRMNPLRRLNDASWKIPNIDNNKVFTCPIKNEFCCSIQDPIRKQVVMVNRHPVLPYQRITEKMRLPYQSETGFYAQDELPYISTIREIQFQRPKNRKDTPNVYEIFYENDHLPSVRCLRCLHLRACLDYEVYCRQYLQRVCEVISPPKFVSKEITVTPPLYRRDPSRLVPRIIHQTWYEELDPDRYPNMSRLVESWKLSGWEYKFYSDRDAEQFLQTHFPSEVLEAYQSLIPGAFKADLFRYCALLIHGGVYADVDIMLEASLDSVVEPDIGFMVPFDEPEGCVWQGFIAAAPGHPFLALAIQTVVNQVRNKFTSIDYDATFCPNPNFKVLHTFDVLFTAGPCLLGASMNRALGRHGQSRFEPGNLLPEWETNATHAANTYNINIPGRTVILKQDKLDMGAHRFTYVANNLVVAATDLQDSDDRKKWPLKDEKSSQNDKFAKPFADQAAEEGGGGETPGAEKAVTASGGGGGGVGEHYSKAHAKTGVYGIEGLYQHYDVIDEDIRVIVDDSRLIRMMSSIESQQQRAIQES